MEPRISIITLGVKDMKRSFKFYQEGLGFPTSASEDDKIMFFKTGGTCLALYPLKKLAEDVSPELPREGSPFPGITLAHNTKKKEEVEAILKLAEKAGGKIVKSAQDTFWGGYSGYFTDPDGYFWEVAYSDSWKFNEDSSLLIE